MIGAINAGANAVYFAGKKFGARAYASNFDTDEIKSMIDYAHIRNVKVYITVNTLVFESEIKDLLSYTDLLVSYHVDALIVQDIGMIELFVNRYPDTAIHASTQMNVYNVHQAKYLKELGVKRIILARETSLETIKEIKKQVDIELEVFIHGALCVSYSGNCSFSFFNGGRSGNRGECAQPCRLPYTLLKEDSVVSEQAYLLSTKDLLTINNIDEIISSDVSSLKVEGRMRSFEYVVETIKSYREVIDHQEESLSKTIKNLKTVFNRDYTKGYILDEKPYHINHSYRPNHQGIEVGKVLDFHNGKVTIKLSDSLSKEDGIRILGTSDVGGKVNRIMKDQTTVQTALNGDTIIIDMIGQIETGATVVKTLDHALNESLTKYHDINYKLIPLDMIVTCKVNEPLMLNVKTPFSQLISTVSDYIVQEAKKNPMRKEDILEQISKLGNTIYITNLITIDTDEKSFIPKSVLNELRRTALENLEKAILNQSKPRIKYNNSYHIQALEEFKESIIVKAETLAQYQVAKDLGIKTIYYKSNIDDNYVFLPRIANSLTTKDKVVIQDFGQVYSSSNEIIANEYLNVVNHYSVASLLSRGIKVITLSQESTFKNTKELIQTFTSKYHFTPPIEIILYSTPDVMISKYCPITKTLGINQLNCGLCERNQYYLKDKENNTYPLIRDQQCNIRVLHKKPINNINMMQNYGSIGVKRFRLEFTTESAETTRSIILSAIKKSNSSS